MTPGGRTAAVLEILGEIASTRRPADRVLAHWAKTHRFAGSKDRAAINGQVWDVLRDWLRLRALSGAEDVRGVLLTHLRDKGMAGDEIAALFSGENHSPSPLNDDEQALLARPFAEPDAAASANLPDFVYDDLAEAADALNTPAPVDLRINTLKADQAKVGRALESAGIGFEVLDDQALRLEGHPKLNGLDAFKAGQFEVQDWGSQIAARMVSPKGIDRVIDLCAGAGGKTLAMAAAMAGKGEILALDIAADRLKRLKPRLAKAGASNIRTEKFSDKTLQRLAGSAGRVLLDVPCSGTGAWRRQVEGRLHFTPDDLTRLCQTQDDLLDKGARLVSPRGRLIYVTCSLLGAENEDRIAAFLDRNPTFRAVDPEPIWMRLQSTSPPKRVLRTHPWGRAVHLGPHLTGTDGYFIAILSQAPKTESSPTSE